MVFGDHMATPLSTMPQHRHLRGYRPKRSAGDAVQAVHKLLCRGYTDVVDADLSKYFDTIPHVLTAERECIEPKLRQTPTVGD